jgi:hypothetical protein
VQRGARPDQEAKGVKERDDDGRHDCRLSENARNLNRRNTYRVLGRHTRENHLPTLPRLLVSMRPERAASRRSSMSTTTATSTCSWVSATHQICSFATTASDSSA